MGRKGMKGFMKSAAKPSTKPEDELAEQQPAAAGDAAPAPAPTTPAGAAASQDAAKGPATSSAATGSSVPDHAPPREEDEEGAGGPETRGQMLQRHKRELLAHKKAVQRMGKKSKDELAKLDAEVEARHARELQQLDAATAAAASSAAAPANPAAAAVVDRASKYLKDLSLGASAAAAADGDDAQDEHEVAGRTKKQTKAQKRRDKQAAKDAERDARIAAEQAELGPSQREEEEEALKLLLAPLGLAVRDIRADGHCLYRSIHDQLRVTAATAAAAAGASAADGGSGGSCSNSSDGGDAADVPDHLELRRLAAAHIRKHSEDFAPFVMAEAEAEEHEGQEEEGGDPAAVLEAYCARLEGTAAWGGHVELTALAAALQRHIKVYAVGMPTVSLGEEHEPAGAPPLQLCYLRHAFGLGEHYNSTKPLRCVRFSGLEDEQQEEDEQ